MASFNSEDDDSAPGGVEEVDYAIMKVLEESDDVLWKKRIYEKVLDCMERLPYLSQTSTQTIGRHVDDLEEEGVLRTGIVTVEGDGNPDRRHMIGYDLTGDGEKRLEQQRKEMIGQIVRSSLSPEDDISMSKAAIVELMVDTFDVEDEEAEAVMHDELEDEELLLVLSAHHFQERFIPYVDEEKLPHLRDVVTSSDRLQESLSPPLLSDKIFDEDELLDR